MVQQLEEKEKRPVSCFTSQRGEKLRNTSAIPGSHNNVESRLCKPLLEGNSRPFYRHLNGGKPKQHISLLSPDGNMTDDPTACSQIINTHFHNQFIRTHTLLRQNDSTHVASCWEIKLSGVMSLPSERPKIWKSSRP